MAKKNMFGRKILSILLAVMMVVGMVGTAFAQGTAEDPYDVGDIAYSASRQTRPEGVIPEDTEWEYQNTTETVYACGLEAHEHSHRCSYGRNCELEEHTHSERRCGVEEASKAVWELVEKKSGNNNWGWGGGYVLDESYYVGSRSFGWDTYSQNATMMDENGNDVYELITVKVGEKTLSKGSLGATNDDVVANGVTIEGIPAGFYISAYKIVCEKYACYTDQAGNATDETVSLDAGKGSYSVGVSKADMGHANTGATKYWILIEISAYEEEKETIVTYPYSVLYNYGELAEELADAAATVDYNTYAMNASATVLSPAAEQAAAALGYTFIGWEVESVRGSFAVTNGVVGMLVDPADSLTITGETTLKALWEKAPVPTYDIGYVVQGTAPATYSAIPAAELDVEVGAARTVAAGLTTTETSKNGVVGTWTFNGWSTDDAAVSEGTFAMPANDVEFVGTWSFEAAPTYSVTYVIEGDAPATYSQIPAAETGILEGAAKTVASGLTTDETVKGTVAGTWTFDGWNTADVEISDGTFEMPANNVRFVGTWSFEAAPTYGYTVVAAYYTNGQPDASRTISVVDGVLALPAASEVEASHSAANTVSNGLTYTYTGISVEGSVYTLRYERAVYEISYRVEGDAPASFSEIPAVESGLEAGTSKNVKAGLSTTETTRNGVVGTWTFNGWATDDAAVVEGVFAMPASNVEFVGTWSFEAAPTYGIRYIVSGDAPASYSELPAVEGGILEGAAKTVAAGLTTAETTRNGIVGTWTFNGWATDDASVSEGAFAMPAGNVEFVGTWSFEAEPTYSVSYVVEGDAPATYSAVPAVETGILKGTEKTIASSLTTVETTREGVVGTWTFNGWTTDDTAVFAGDYTMPAADVQFVGTWSFEAAPTYSVTYVVEGDAPAAYSLIPAAEEGILEGAAKTVAAGLTTIMTTKGDVVGTWTFNGWTTDDASVSAGAYTMPGQDVQFVGTWSFVAAPTYGYVVVAEYYTNNETDASKVITTVDGVLALPEAAEVEAAYSADNNVNNELTYAYTSISVADGIYTLRYDRAVYQISYRVEGEAPASFSEIPAVESGIEAGTAKTVASGLTTTETAKDGVVGTWTFNGWATEDAAVAEGAFEMPAANVEFVGTWSFEAAPTFTITYTVEGDAPATFSEISPIESGVLEGAEKTVAAGLTTTETTRDGVVGTWTFNGWTTDDAAVSNGVFKMPAQNVVFVGTWTFTEYVEFVTPVEPTPDPEPQPEPTPDPVSGDEELEDLPDEDVPLADVPQTGGLVGLFIAMTAVSGAGLLALNLKKKEEEE